MISHHLLRQRPLRVIVLVLAMPLLVLLAASSHGQDVPVVEYSQDPGEIVIQMTRVLGEFRGDGIPVLRIFGDGKVLVHYPVGMLKAGDYTKRLSADEMKGLLSSLVTKGVLDFDAQATKAELRSIRAAARSTNGGPIQVHSVSDKTLTSIEVNVASYKAAEAQRAETNVQTRATWAGLRDDAKEYADVQSLVALAAAEQELLALTESEDLEKV